MTAVLGKLQKNYRCSGIIINKFCNYFENDCNYTQLLFTLEGEGMKEEKRINDEDKVGSDGGSFDDYDDDYDDECGDDGVAGDGDADDGDADDDKLMIRW